MKRLVALAACLVLAACSLGQADSVNFPLTVRKEMDLDVRGEAVALTWSVDGSKLAAASDLGATLTVWDRAGHQLSQVESHADGPAVSGSIEFTPDASQLLFSTNDRNHQTVAFNIIDPRTGTASILVDGTKRFNSAPLNNAWNFRMSPDQKTVVMAPSENFFGKQLQDSVYFYNTSNWHIEHSFRVEEIVSYLNFFDGGSKVVVGAVSEEPDKAVVYVSGTNAGSAPTRLEISDVPNTGVRVVSGSPDGQFIFVGLDGNGEDHHQSHGKPSNSVARILRVSDGAQMATLPPAWGPIWATEWDPQDRYVAFIDGTGDLYIWRPFATDLSYSKIHLSNGARALAVSPDGNRIAAGAGSTVRVYSVE